MTEMAVQTYKPPGPVGAAFLHDTTSIVRGLMGPYGSGKTNLLFFDGLKNAAAMPVCRDGVRRYRHTFIRDTYANLWDKLLPSWWQWYPQTVGRWSGSEGRLARHTLRFDQQPDGIPIEIDFHFRALQDWSIENFVRGLETTMASVNEADLISGELLTHLVGRVLQRRYPSLQMLRPEDIRHNDQGEPEPQYRVGVTFDMNPPDVDHELYRKFEEERPEGWTLYKQPSGRGPHGENRQGVSRAAYIEMAALNADKPWWVRRMVDGQYGFSRDGEPVYTNYDDDRHCVEDGLKPLPGVPLNLGFDQGVTGPAMIVAQRTYDGQLRILDEVVPGRMGPTRFGELCLLTLRDRYAGLEIRSAAVDPAGFAGGDKEGGDKAWAETVSDKLGIPLVPAPTQELAIRIDGVDQLLRYQIEPARPALVLDGRRCPNLRKGFASHYRYKVKGEGKARQISPSPEKNFWSNPHDALQYLVLDAFGLDAVMAGLGGAGAAGGAAAARGGRGGDDDDDDIPRRPADVVNSDFDVFSV